MYSIILCWFIYSICTEYALCTVLYYIGHQLMYVLYMYVCIYVLVYTRD